MINYVSAIFHENSSMKICRNCGHMNPINYRFCENCGNPFSHEENKTTEEDIKESDKPESKTKKSRKKLIIGILIAILVVAAVVVALLMYLNNKDMAEYNDKVDEADRYMEELDYEKAEIAYLEAIEIEPKESEAYVKAADVYVAQERYQEAEEILEKGETQAGGKDIAEKLEQVRPYRVYDEYLRNTLVPEVGLADVDVELSYDTLTPGLMSALIEDFDLDGIPDLLTVEYGNYEPTVLTISLYTCIGGEVELLDEMENDYGDHVYNASQYDIFLKEHEERYYIVIGYEGLYGDGGGYCVEIYEINKALQEAVNTAYVNGIGFGSYSVNGKVVSQFDYSEDLGNADTDYLKEVDERGISAFEAALSKYGFTRERFSDTSDGFINYSNMKYDENEASERHICYIQHGIYYWDGSIELSDMGVTRYLIDYTGLRARIGQ